MRQTYQQKGPKMECLAAGAIDNDEVLVDRRFTCEAPAGKFRMVIHDIVIDAKWVERDFDDVARARTSGKNRMAADPNLRIWIYDETGTDVTEEDPIL